MSNYIVNPNFEIDREHSVIPNSRIVQIVNKTNQGIQQLYNLTPYIFETLGMRNLSGFVGEYFARCFRDCSEGKLESNPHIDGFPDLLLNDTEEKRAFLASNIQIGTNGKPHAINKEIFSPYQYGGIEVKATCGGVTKQNLLVGEQRFPNVTSLGWKAHHSNVNHLLGVLWDFIEEVPTIVAVFYQDNLTAEDWRTPYRPSGDSHGTNMVGMSTSGIKHLCTNWWCVIDDELYINSLSKAQWIGYNIKTNA